MHDFQEQGQTVFRVTVCQKLYPAKVFLWLTKKSLTQRAWKASLKVF